MISFLTFSDPANSRHTTFHLYVRAFSIYTVSCTELELGCLIASPSDVDAATVYYLSRWVVYHESSKTIYVRFVLLFCSCFIAENLVTELLSLFQCLKDCSSTFTMMNRSSHASSQAVSYMWCHGSN
jgi:hypothetical protein